MSATVRRKTESLTTKLEDAKKKLAADQKALTANKAEVKKNDASFRQAEVALPMYKDIFETERKAEDATLGAKAKSLKKEISSEKKEIASLEKNPKLLPAEIADAKKALASDKSALATSVANQKSLDTFVKQLETLDPTNKATYEKDLAATDAQAKTEQAGLKTKISGDEKEIKKLEKAEAIQKKKAGSSSKNVNPLGPGWSLGRTDQGVDANAAPGTPIKAINDSKVVHISPNWYAGQPLVLMQLTSGPDKGKYWYVSEQIDHIPSVGQTIKRGQVVARYASSGTGIEIGWGSPQGPGYTLAQQLGEINNDPSHADTAAGIDFRNKILSIRS